MNKRTEARLRAIVTESVVYAIGFAEGLKPVFEDDVRVKRIYARPTADAGGVAHLFRTISAEYPDKPITWVLNEIHAIFLDIEAKDARDE